MDKNEKKVKETKKEDVLKYVHIYKEHFTEKALIQRAENFAYNFMVKHGMAGKDAGWKGGRAVYGQLPFGEQAEYVVKASYGKTWTAKVFTTINNDEETILVNIECGKYKDALLIEHLTIKHGYVEWNLLNMPAADFGEPETKTGYVAKDPTPSDTVRPRVQRQQQPMYPPAMGYFW